MKIPDMGKETGGREDAMRILKMSLVLCFLLWVTPLAAETEGNAYRLGAGDVVKVSVWKQDTLEREVTIGPDGSISFSPIGTVQIGGLTRSEAETLIERLLSSYIYEPQVTLTVQAYTSRRVNVIGMVNNPGIVTIPGDFLLLAAVSGAGGVRTEADLRHCVVQRGGKEILRVDLYELLMNGKMELNVPLEVDDTVYVPDNSDNNIYVLGAVKNPGPASQRGAETTLLEAITERGGVTDTAYLAGCTITRDKTNIINVNLHDLLYKGDNTLDIQLQAGDVVFVPDPIDSHVYVLGEVKTPGVYNLTSGKNPIVEIIARAGGFDEDADLPRIRIYRGDLQNPEIIQIPFNKVFGKGDEASARVVQPGDIIYVPTRLLGKIDYVFRKLSAGINTVSLGLIAYDIIDDHGK